MKLMRRRQAGFSLVELMIVLVIITLVSGALYMMLATAGNTYGNLSSTGDAQERARRILDEMTKELRMADQATLSITTTVTTNDTITFQVPEVDPATGLAQLDSATNQVKWAVRLQYLFQKTVLDPVTKLPSVSVDANNNGIEDEGRIVRKVEKAPRADPKTWTLPITYDATKQRTLTDFVKLGGITYTKTTDNIVISVTFISVDHKNRVIETTLHSSVTLRNSST